MASPGSGADDEGHDQAEREASKPLGEPFGELEADAEATDEPALPHEAKTATSEPLDGQRSYLDSPAARNLPVEGCPPLSPGAIRQTRVHTAHSVYRRP